MEDSRWTTAKNMTDHFPDSDLTRPSLLARLAAAPPAERENAWVEFQSRYLPVIRAFASRCGASRQDIDDIAQDVMTAFVGAQPEFTYDRSRGRFRGYLKTITVRAAIRRVGKNLRFKGLPLQDVPDADLAVEPLWNDIWERELVAQALRLVRQECQDSLAFRAFEQHVLLDRPAEDVAAELGTSVNNVHQAKSRITRQLREAVQRLRTNDA